jgi:hypothetical protein
MRDREAQPHSDKPCNIKCRSSNASGGGIEIFAFSDKPPGAIQKEPMQHAGPQRQNDYMHRKEGPSSYFWYAQRTSLPSFE